MRTTVLTFLVLLFGLRLAPSQMFNAPGPAVSFTHCHLVTVETDFNHTFGQESATFLCDQGYINLRGPNDLQIEYGYVYESQFGSFVETHDHATLLDKQSYVWCRAGIDTVRALRRRDSAHLDTRGLLQPWTPAPSSYPRCPVDPVEQYLRDKLTFAPADEGNFVPTR